MSVEKKTTSAVDDRDEHTRNNNPTTNDDGTNNNDIESQLKDAAKAISAPASAAAAATGGAAGSGDDDDCDRSGSDVPKRMIVPNVSCQTPDDDNDDDPDSKGRFASPTNGAYFAVMLIVVQILFGVTRMFNLYMVLAKGCGYTNPLAICYGHTELERETKGGKSLVGTHALLGYAWISLCTFQGVSYLLFRRRRRNQGGDDRDEDHWLRRFHRQIGTFIAVYLTFGTILFGGLYSLISHRWNSTEFWVRLAVSLPIWGSGAACLANVVVGYFAVAGGGGGIPATTNHKGGEGQGDNGNHQHREKDFLLHKCCMGFSAYWICASGMQEIIQSVLQSTMYMCDLGNLGKTLCILTGQFLLYLILVGTIVRYES